MELQNNKCAIVCVGVGGWYAKGVDRLESSLNYHGYWGKFFGWKDELPEGAETHLQNPYNYKLHAIEYARDRGYTHVLLCDASLWAIKNPMPVFDYFNEHGIFAFRTGYNCAQSVNDRTLRAFGVERDEAENITEYASGCVGFNFKNPKAMEVYNEWWIAMRKGLFKGSRQHDGQSSDPRFLFHRQDQSSLSMVLYKNKVDIPQTELIAYYKPDYKNEKTVFFINGL